MRFDKALCWAFDVVPSKLNKLYWENSFNDLKFKVGLKLEEKNAEVMQNFETLIIVVSKALGGSKNNEVIEVKNENDIKRGFQKVFGDG